MMPEPDHHPQTEVAGELPTTQAYRVASFLGVQGEADTKVTLADAVARGLPASSVEALRARLSGDVVSQILSPATLTRARSQGAKPLSRETSEKLYEFGRTYEHALRLFHGDADKVLRFLQKPNALLNGKTPLALATSSSAGADAVTDLLFRAEAGFAA